jgi:hypothetical protein
MNEPEKKDGIWIQSDSQYKKIITDARILNQNNDVWASVSDIVNTPNGMGYLYQYAGVVYMYVDHHIYIININNWTITDTGSKLYDVWENTSSNICNIGSYLYYLGYSSSSYGDGNLFVYKYNIINKTTTKIYNVSYFDYGHNLILCKPFMYNDHLCIGFYDNSSTISFNIYDFVSKSSIITGPTYFSHNTIDPVVIYNGCIYYVDINVNGGSDYGLYRYNGVWTRISIPDIDTNNFPYNTPYLLLYNNELHLLCCTRYKYHYKYNTVNNSFIKLADPAFRYSPENSYYLAVDNDIYIFMQASNVYSHEVIKYSLSYNVFDPNTLIIQRGEDNGKYKTAFADLTKSVSGVNRFISGFDDCYYYGTGSFEAAPMYYGNGSQWIRFKN